MKMGSKAPPFGKGGKVVSKPSKSVPPKGKDAKFGKKMKDC